MSSGQMIMALGALMLLSMLALSLNSIMLDGNRTMMESELYIGATSVAQSFIEHAAVLRFDEEEGGHDPSTFPGTFTYSGSLGPDGEIYPNFDDVDDFNDYAASVATNRVTYDVAITVVYCKSSGTETANRTYFKKMEITAGCPFIPTDVVVTRIFAYTI